MDTQVLSITSAAGFPLFCMNVVMLIHQTGTGSEVTRQFVCLGVKKTVAFKRNFKYETCFFYIYIHNDRIRIPEKWKKPIAQNRLRGSKRRGGSRFCQLLSSFC